MTKTTDIKSIANVTKHTPNKLLLLTLSVESQKTSAMVDSGTTHNLIFYNMLDIINPLCMIASSGGMLVNLCRSA